jgi:hypothetical protein
MGKERIDHRWEPCSLVEYKITPTKFVVANARSLGAFDDSVKAAITLVKNQFAICYLDSVVSRDSRSASKYRQDWGGAVPKSLLQVCPLQ